MAEILDKLDERRKLMVQKYARLCVTDPDQAIIFWAETMRDEVGGELTEANLDEATDEAQTGLYDGIDFDDLISKTPIPDPEIEGTV